MKYKTSLAAIMLSAIIVSAPGLAGAAYAHEGCDKNAQSMHCEHHPLSKDKMALLQSTFNKLHEDNKAAFEEMHKLGKEQHDILAAKTFDKEAYLSVSAKIEDNRAQLAKSHSEAFASIADKFTPKERERLNHMWGHHHHDWKHGKGHEGWHHHDAQKDGMNDKNQMPAEAPKEEPAPPPVQ